MRVRQSYRLRRPSNVRRTLVIRSSWPPLNRYAGEQHRGKRCAIEARLADIDIDPFFTVLMSAASFSTGTRHESSTVRTGAVEA
jgi:hypothetical protein